MNSQRSNSGTPAPHYHAFINFRGGDIREDLIDILRHFMVQSGLRFFYDDDSLRHGDVIGDKIYQGIERSQVYIVMLSTNYANSKWCLRELEHMVRCQEQGGHGRKVILPVFCGVRVEDVKLSEGSSYSTDLGRLSAGAQELRYWKEALKKVAKIKGLHKGNMGAVDFSKMIVGEVQSRILMRPMSYHLVGIDEKVVEEELNAESGDVRFLVIYGKEGIGKTTLARVVFQQLSARFEGSSFIVDVTEMEKRYSYLYLQNKLLKDIIGDDRKTQVFEESFRDKKVLIVLDGVERWEQIEKLAGSSTWFGPGSRIIITSSCLGVRHVQREMHERNSNPARELLVHPMEEMGHNEALKLFSRYAFWQDSPCENYEIISHDIVQSCCRLPLMLEIMGSLLHGIRNTGEWGEIYQQLESSESVRGKLMISYKKLQPSAQKIFLDIACFFVNEEKTNPFYMWNAPEDAKGIKDLLMLSLVKIVDGNKLWMHDSLRDLGREIVRQKSELLEARCRFWEHKEALEVLQYREGQQKVEAICSHYYETGEYSLEHITPREFFGKRMLRFLRLYSVKFQGDFKDLLKKLKWLSWHYSPEDFEATHFASAALVILDLARSSITDEWDGWRQLKEENNLKVIDLTRCERLTKTPSFSLFKGLERVILEGCKNLAEIDHSIGELKGLKCLNIRGCDSLKELPEQICSVERLEEIQVTKEVHGPFSLPREIGSLKSLIILEIVNVKIHAIPDSIGRLEKLQRLSLLSCSGFKDLPNSMGNLQSLAELQISETKLVRLPESIGSLKELKVIKMEDSLITGLPHGITEAEKLEEIHSNNCKHLTGDIPNGIEKLCHLKVLELSNTSICKLPMTVTKLSYLQKLQLPPSCKLQNPSNLPGSLTSLGITFQSLRKVHNLLEGLTKLEKLELIITQNTICDTPLRFPPQLKSLVLSCQDLRCCLALPASLSELILKKVALHTVLPHLNNLENLVSLQLNECELGDNTYGSIQQENVVANIFGKLNKLKHFCASRCQFGIIDGLHLPKDLRVLYINDCKFYGDVLQVSGLESLRQLRILECEGLGAVEGLGELASLEELRIEYCSSLSRLGGNLSNSQRLNVYVVVGNDMLQDFELLDKAFRERLKRYELTIIQLPSNDRSSSRTREVTVQEGTTSLNNAQQIAPRHPFWSQIWRRIWRL